MRIDDVRRITLGTFVRPAEETGGEPRVEGVYGYLVRHEHGLVLLDTGIGAGDEETEAWYRPSGSRSSRRSLRQASTLPT